MIKLLANNCWHITEFQDFDRHALYTIDNELLVIIELIYDMRINNSTKTYTWFCGDKLNLMDPNVIKELKYNNFVIIAGTNKAVRHEDIVKGYENLLYMKNNIIQILSKFIDVKFLTEEQMLLL